MKEYVCGFMFNPERTQVLLIRKDRPDWQAGKLNGVGGKVENTDRMLSVGKDGVPSSDKSTPMYSAMVREFKEEVGIETLPEDWELFAICEGDNSRIYNFRTFSDKLYDFKQVESEEPELIVVDLLHKEITVPNISFLVPMALNTDELFNIKCKIRG